MWNLLSDSQCELGESPFWHPVERALYWLDIPGRAALRTRGDIAHATVERWSLPAEPGCMAPARTGGVVIALRDGIYRAREWGGPLVQLAAADYDTRTVRFNDGKCDPLGRFWAGTLNEAKDGPTAALYCLDARRGATPRMARVLGGVSNANGLAFAPDARTFYWADTTAHRVRAWDWEMVGDARSNERVFQQFRTKPEGWTPASSVPYGGRPDGAAVDTAGRYWVSMFEGARVLGFSPTGEEIAALPLPVQCPTMPCFGGEDLQTLFVTTARKGRPADEIARWPASGSVIWQRVDTPGLPVNFFED